MDIASGDASVPPGSPRGGVFPEELRASYPEITESLEGNMHRASCFDHSLHIRTARKRKRIGSGRDYELKAVRRVHLVLSDNPRTRPARPALAFRRLPTVDRPKEHLPRKPGSRRLRLRPQKTHWTAPNRRRHSTTPWARTHRASRYWPRPTAPWRCSRKSLSHRLIRADT